MKLSFVFIIPLLLGSLATFAPEVRSQQSDAAEQEMISLSRQWMEALERKDQPALERFLAEEFYLGSPGDVKRTGRGEWLRNALEMDWSDLRYHNIKADIYGDTAVVTSLLDFKVTTKSGIPLSVTGQATDVWVKRNGQWQVTARLLGSSSLERWLRLIGGFVAGIALCLAIWLLLKLKRRSAAKRMPSPA